jgi:hypothetical protein
VSWRVWLAGLLLIFGHLAVGTSSSRAQSVGSRSSLGGYGATESMAPAGMGAGGPIIPYAGNFGGFIPYRMGGGSPLSFSSRERSAMGPGRMSLTFPAMTGAMMPPSGGLMPGGRAGLGRLSSFGLQDRMGLGGAIRRPMTGAGSMNVMPPNFGYPFYQPPSLIGPSPSTGGMSM